MEKRIGFKRAFTYMYNNKSKCLSSTRIIGSDERSTYIIHQQCPLHKGGPGNGSVTTGKAQESSVRKNRSEEELLRQRERNGGMRKKIKNREHERPTKTEVYGSENDEKTK